MSDIDRREASKQSRQAQSQGSLSHRAALMAAGLFEERFGSSSGKEKVTTLRGGAGHYDRPLAGMRVEGIRAVNFGIERMSHPHLG